MKMYELNSGLYFSELQQNQVTLPGRYDSLCEEH